ncbi:unnamed protein product [Eruca vesicaria subsp. sativa]|uniref:Uncharacterized protein n=1 Tax=Eruca vesicaria subsp. sativa TaxID=29727 RepID=A0ABC8LNC5_ERUVS|nr:unnamed protein product [Eruca vesicaria subsp. sativa]
MRYREDRKTYRQGDIRYRTGPYKRQQDHIWREKSRDGVSGEEREGSSTLRGVDRIAPYAQPAGSGAVALGTTTSTCSAMDKGKASTSVRRLASAIVSPTGTAHVHEGNITIREKGATRALTFSPRSLHVEDNCLENDQMIEALHDEDTEEQSVGRLLESEGQDFDLLGEELKEMEETRVGSVLESSTSRRAVHKPSRMNVPLGIQSKKTEFLRRGSPRSLAAKSPGPRGILRDVSLLCSATTLSSAPRRLSPLLRDDSLIHYFSDVSFLLSSYAPSRLLSVSAPLLVCYATAPLLVFSATATLLFCSATATLLVCSATAPLLRDVSRRRQFCSCVTAAEETN